jgi:sialate O-acetylesterase
MIKLVRFLIFFLCLPIYPQNNKNLPWIGKECAVVLTYDDALDVHLDYVIPYLNKQNVRATFYLPGKATSVSSRMDEWEIVAASGHELGNHSLFHPCHGLSKNRKWVKPEYDLDTYTLSRLLDELDLANSLLKAIDGERKRTYAYTCGDLEVEDSIYTPLLYDRFVAARGVQKGFNIPGKINWFNLKIFGVHDAQADELIKQVEQAREKNALLVFVFHGVGGGHSLNVSIDVHHKLIDYLQQNENYIWVAPLIEIAEPCKKTQGN